MEELVLEIVNILRSGKAVDDGVIASLARKHNTGISDVKRHLSKKKLLPFVLKVREEDPERWDSWHISTDEERLLMKALRAKPRRTASGVATITVITKPWPCGSNCRYCPNDVRMPKSYLSDEPACQRAERNFFDPYLQVASRLYTLTQMGHVTDKVELIVLGGTWRDYPEAYQVWFVKELFRALNDSDDVRESEMRRLRQSYYEAGLHTSRAKLEEYVGAWQEQVNLGETTYAQAWPHLYGEATVWHTIGAVQVAAMDELQAQHAENVNAHHRCVGLVVETRPDTINCEALTFLRSLGCTKIQIGVQTLDDAIHAANNRRVNREMLARSFELLRAYGFKIHSHFMANLLGSSPEKDVRDYADFMTAPAFQPDEVKLYPCTLIGGTALCNDYKAGEWVPYDEDTLVGVLAQDVCCTPAFTRVSRMIRDFSAASIQAGNKKTNLRQMVEARIAQSSKAVQEIRYREIMLHDVDPSQLELQVVPYETSNTHEYFLQWVTKEGGIAGFCRLSLPNKAFLAQHPDIPVGERNAMIREVHVYGKVAGIDAGRGGAQHMGLGRQLVAKACEIAKENGYEGINVISAIGTRGYYEKLGFEQADLYQRKTL